MSSLLCGLQLFGFLRKRFKWRTKFRRRCRKTKGILHKPGDIGTDKGIIRARKEEHHGSLPFSDRLHWRSYEKRIFFGDRCNASLITYFFNGHMCGVLPKRCGEKPVRRLET